MKRKFHQQQEQPEKKTKVSQIERKEQIEEQKEQKEQKKRVGFATLILAQLKPSFLDLQPVLPHPPMALPTISTNQLSFCLFVALPNFPVVLLELIENYSLSCLLSLKEAEAWNFWSARGCFPSKQLIGSQEDRGWFSRLEEEHKIEDATSWRGSEYDFLNPCVDGFSFNFFTYSEEDNSQNPTHISLEARDMRCKSSRETQVVNNLKLRTPGFLLSGTRWRPNTYRFQALMSNMQLPFGHEEDNEDIEDEHVELKNYLSLLSYDVKTSAWKESLLVKDIMEMFADTHPFPRTRYGLCRDVSDLELVAGEEVPQSCLLHLRAGGRHIYTWSCNLPASATFVCDILPPSFVLDSSILFDSKLWIIVRIPHKHLTYLACSLYLLPSTKSYQMHNSLDFLCRYQIIAELGSNNIPEEDKKCHCYSSPGKEKEKEKEKEKCTSSYCTTYFSLALVPNDFGQTQVAVIHHKFPRRSALRDLGRKRDPVLLTSDLDFEKKFAARLKKDTQEEMEATNKLLVTQKENYLTIENFGLDDNFTVAWFPNIMSL